MNYSQTKERVAWAVCAALNANGRMSYVDIFRAVDADVYNGNLGERDEYLLEDVLDEGCSSGVIGTAGEGLERRYFMLPEY